MVILKKKVAGASAASLARFAKRAGDLAALEGKFNVFITDDGDLREWNARFRGKDKSTDVLTFPAAQPDFAGEIAIASGIAAANAKSYGHSVTEEIKILILHGILHLCGCDHEKDDGMMSRREEKLRLALRLPTGLIGRNSGKAGVAEKAGRTNKPGRR